MFRVAPFAKQDAPGAETGPETFFVLGNPAPKRLVLALHSGDEHTATALRGDVTMLAHGKTDSGAVDLLLHRQGPHEEGRRGFLRKELVAARGPWTEPGQVRRARELDEWLRHGRPRGLQAGVRRSYRDTQPSPRHSR